MDTLDPQSPVKRYGVAVVGSRYEYAYEDDNAPEGVSVITLRARRSLSFEEHLAHVRERAMIANMAYTMGRDLAAGLEKMNALTEADAEAEGIDLGALQSRVINEITSKAATQQEGQWERTKEQILRLISPLQHEEFAPILDRADPAQINELLADMEKELIERQREETRVAASVDPTLPTPQSGSSNGPTSGPPSDSTE